MSDQLDKQLSPGMAPPASCTNGCARWANLAKDGNTSSQADINQRWTNGMPPSSADNLCARPANFPQDAPYCMCAGTNDDSWGYCQNKDAASAVCKAVPNGLNKLYGEMDDCRSSTEEARLNDFMSKNMKIKREVEDMSLSVQDSLVLGDSMYGTTGYKKIVDEVRERNKSLVDKKEKLLKGLEKKEAIVERTERDFIDTRESMPEKLKPSRLNTIEDYTLAFLSIAYLFAVIALIYMYVSNSEVKGKAIGMGIIGAIIASMFLFTILYIVI
jgi:hypothetical protein